MWSDIASKLESASEWFPKSASASELVSEWIVNASGTRGEVVGRGKKDIIRSRVKIARRVKAPSVGIRID